MTSRLSGLYAITPSTLSDPELLLEVVSQALAGGARLIQYRNKSTDDKQRLATARCLRDITHQYHALLLINDDVNLAREIGADGVHLGRDDMELITARRILGNEAVIGISCYNHFELAVQAARQGADYVAFGSFFPSRTKPDAVRADLPLLQYAAQQLELPVVAIGGINADNAGSLLEAGADMLAVVEAVFGSNDIQQAARRLANLFNRRTQSEYGDELAGK